MVGGRGTFLVEKLHDHGLGTGDGSDDMADMPKDMGLKQGSYLARG